MMHRAFTTPTRRLLAPSPPSISLPDAEAVTRVVFESARRSGVDVPATTSSSSSSSNHSNIPSSETINTDMTSSPAGFFHHHHYPYHNVVASEAAKRQAREYALRVQRFREQQKKVVSSSASAAAAPIVPAATIQFSINNEIGADFGDNNEDPLQNLFSGIEAPRVKQMTKPISMQPSSRQVPSLFEKQSEQSKQQLSDTSSSLPPVIVSAMSGKKKRPPSPTRKASPLTKPSPSSKFPQITTTTTGAAISAESLKLNLPSTQRKASPLPKDHEKSKISLSVPGVTTIDTKKKVAVVETTKIAAAAAAVEEKVQEQQEEISTAATFEHVVRPSVQTQTVSSAYAAAATTPTMKTTTQLEAKQIDQDQATRLVQEERTTEEPILPSQTLSSVTAETDKQQQLQQQQQYQQAQTFEGESATSVSSVEQWSSLRASELEAMRSEQEAAVAAAEAEKIAKIEKEKIDVWIKSRTENQQPIDPLTHFAGKTPMIKELNDLFRAATWEHAFSAFSVIHKEPSTNKESLYHALSLAASHTWRWNTERKMSVQPVFNDIMSKLRIPNNSTKNLLYMSLHSDEAAAERFLALPNSERALLPRFMFERYTWKYFNTMFRAGSWHEALNFVTEIKQLRADPFLRIETLLLRVLSSAGVTPFSRRPQIVVVLQAIEQQCRNKLSQLGKTHAVQLMYAYGRLRQLHEVRRIYNEMKERGELDEEISAAYLRTSNTQTIETTIPELRKNGINVLSSACTRAIVYAMLGRKEVAPALEALRAFATVAPPSDWSIFDLRACAAAMQEASDGEAPSPPDPALVDTMRSAALSTYQKAGEAACPRVTSQLILNLLELGRTQDVLEIGRTICNPSNNKILDKLSETAFDALNSTLISANLVPRVISGERETVMNDIVQRTREREERIASAAASRDGGAEETTTTATTTSKTTLAPPPSQQQQHQQVSSSTDIGTTTSSTTGISPQISEKMLEFGRTRNWTEALSLLNSLQLGSVSNPVTPQNTTAVTLLYNCAISAAVDHVDVVDDIVKNMQTSNIGLQPNATTNNTIMTAFGKSEDRWGEALELFQQASAKDASSYSVALSVLGKRGQWEQASRVFSEMKKQPGMTKPSTVAYGLLIQAAHRDNWLMTLRAFQEMTKLHGSTSAREVVVNRVVKALDGANRTAEATRVLESLRKQKK